MFFAVTFYIDFKYFSLAGNFFFHFAIYVSLGMSLLKPTFIDLHC